MRSVDRLQERMRPDWSTSTIASAAVSTMGPVAGLRPPDLAFLRLAGRDVLEVDRQPLPGGKGADGEPDAGGAGERLELRRPLDRHRGAVPPLEGGPVHLGEGLPQQGPGGGAAVAEEQPGAVVQEADPPFAVDLDHAVGRARQHRRHAPLGLVRGLADALAVLERRRHAVECRSQHRDLADVAAQVRARRIVAVPPAAGRRHQPRGRPPDEMVHAERRHGQHRHNVQQGQQKAAARRAVDDGECRRLVDADRDEHLVQAGGDGRERDHAIDPVEPGPLDHAAVGRTEQLQVVLRQPRPRPLLRGGQARDDRTVAVGERHRRVLGQRHGGEMGLEPGQAERRRHHPRDRAPLVLVGLREDDRSTPVLVPDEAADGARLRAGAAAPHGPAEIVPLGDLLPEHPGRAGAQDPPPAVGGEDGEVLGQAQPDALKIGLAAGGVPGMQDVRFGQAV
ncbi:MAG TPA: hypothetical protein VGO20_22215 [Arenibaculum sp.]|nr:hypothetical protein [Arenibaculum sp.]